VAAGSNCDIGLRPRISSIVQNMRAILIWALSPPRRVRAPSLQPHKTTLL
jgi:hypothetical protein